tara:strand:+ start:185 stop:541 length:357 start_codon:yes stop_codon:yes gene_type:complete
MLSFKQSNDFDQRKKESTKIIAKFPNKVPVIAEKGKNTEIQQADKNKFLVHEEMTLAQFIVVLRKRIKLKEAEALFIYVGDSTLAATSIKMSELYDKHKDPDGFLYLTYCSENTFGSL